MEIIKQIIGIMGITHLNILVYIKLINPLYSFVIDGNNYFIVIYLLYSQFTVLIFKFITY